MLRKDIYQMLQEYKLSGFFFYFLFFMHVSVFLFKDGTLSCTMNGHKSVVSTLAVCDEVLYSGSWDGTIRLWSLIDHSPLTVLGEDTSGTVTSILALAVDRHMLIAAQENGRIKVLYSLNLELNWFLFLSSYYQSQKLSL